MWLEPLFAQSLGRQVDVPVPIGLVAATLVGGALVGVLVGLICARQVASVEIREALEG